ncbi:hypothetical protein [Sulfitobacter aestuariivivens]|uniref:Uncharacterized protein n=1 Tax=Sulfitobacter aestuariivivens TaxID=2766981 RepID=A0A927HFP9_9RHOB|nr:hypothetical protein [Sulfitobacter aestuariivivens]MBD3664659.1 hypothetical protein [Sulfitobacter aestuariivivens]
MQLAPGIETFGENVRAGRDLRHSCSDPVGTCVLSTRFETFSIAPSRGAIGTMALCAGDIARRPCRLPEDLM